MISERSSQNGEVKTPLPGVSQARITPLPAQPQFISRLALLDWLEQESPRSILMMAPAGYGKTSLAAQWAAMHPEKMVWCTVSRQDTSYDTVISFVAAIRRIRPTFAPWMDQLVGQEFDRVQATIRVCNEIGTWDDDFYFVFDDVDHLPNDHIEILQTWIDNAPLNIKTLSMRSTLPVITYSRPVNMDAMRFITSADLRFTDEQIKVLATQRGLDVEDGEIARALAMADGWPAGVQMVINTIAEQGHYESLGARIASDLRHQNIIQAALAVLEEDQIAFLQEMAFHDDFDLETVHSLNLHSYDDSTIQALVRNHIFLIQVSDTPIRYSLNQIIRSYLIEQLREDPKRLNLIASRAADYYLAQGDLLKALLLLEQISDSERLLAIAENHLLEIMFTANRQLFYRCVESLEGHLQIDEIGSLYLRAAFEAVTGNRDAATVLHHSLRSAINSSNSAQAGTRELSLLETRLALLDGRLGEVIDQARTMLTLSPDQRTSAQAHVVTVFRAGAIAAFLMEDHENLLLMLNACQEITGPLPLLVSTISIPAVSALVSLAEGRLRDSVEFSLFALANAEKMKISGMFFPFEAVYCLADAYREYGELKRAEAVIYKYLPIAQEFKQTHWIAAFYAKLALIAVGRGEVSGSLGLIRTAREAVAGPTFGNDISRVIDEHELLVRVALVDTERITELLYRMPPSKTPMSFTLSYQAQRHPNQAESLLADFPVGNPREELMHELMAAQIFVENSTHAREHLERAIEIAMKNGFKAIFGLQADRVQNHLLEIATRQPTLYMEQLAAMLRERMSKREDPSGGHGIPLTKRELDILRRLATGLPLVQIAGTLHISQNTIKTHLKNLYRKMDVESRQEAVTRGRELSLL